MMLGFWWGRGWSPPRDAPEERHQEAAHRSGTDIAFAQLTNSGVPALQNQRLYLMLQATGSIRLREL
jgi:hypothetical protein